MNSRCCALALLLLISGPALAADTSLPPMSPVGLWLITLGIVFLIAYADLEFDCRGQEFDDCLSAAD